MAPSTDDADCRKAYPEAVNPFVAFRRFADDQMSSLMNSVFGISSVFTSSSRSPETAIQDYDSWLKEGRESRQRLAREEQEAGRIMDLYTKAHQEGSDPYNNEAQNQSRYSEDGASCPYLARRAGDRAAETHSSQDPDYPPSLHPESGKAVSFTSLGNHLSTEEAAARLNEDPRNVFPLSYLIHSRYSPLHLERQEQSCERGDKWRAAFEDLIASQDDQDQNSNPAKETQDGQRSGLGWVMSMLELRHPADVEDFCKALCSTARLAMPLASLGAREATYEEEEDGLEDEEGEGREREEYDKEDEEMTELDLYDRLKTSNGLLSRICSEALKVQSQSLAEELEQAPPLVTERDNKKPGILSTLTTTERTTLPDGSVHTKVVLKKKFSDGREESTETIHTQNALAEQQKGAIVKASQEQRASKQEDNVGGKGWFWS